MRRFLHASARAAKIADGPGLREFTANVAAAKASPQLGGDAADAPYLTPAPMRPRRIFFETYGCQMNTSDTEVAWALLQAAGHQRAGTSEEADVALLVTCAIRDHAESKVFKRLEELAAQNRSRRRAGGAGRLQVGVLGCMAERLKTTLLDMKLGVDFVVGPDAYRDLPHMVAAGAGPPQVNVLLSLDETYADVTPVRLTPGQPSAFLSVMRGCDNMCSYCIVPFTRGRERSRPLASILDEVRQLADQGVREVTLLGQNVNSYRDTSTSEGGAGLAAASLSKGFSTIYKRRLTGQRFADLLHAVSEVAPRTMRIRFTSPHPKDFSDELLHVVRDQPNVCKQLHLPAQSGSTAVLAAMRRGYTREAYLELIDHVRATIPGVSISSDFIAGFCGETEEDHAATLALLRAVQYDAAFLFAYSMRGKTHAYHRLQDDVPAADKQRRLAELIAAFQAGAASANARRVGTEQMVLVEGPSKRDPHQWTGRTDGNMTAVFPAGPLPVATTPGVPPRDVRVGDFVRVRVHASTSRTLMATPLDLHEAL